MTFFITEVLSPLFDDASKKVRVWNLRRKLLIQKSSPREVSFFSYSFAFTPVSFYPTIPL